MRVNFAFLFAFVLIICLVSTDLVDAKKKKKKSKGSKKSVKTSETGAASATTTPESRKTFRSPRDWSKLSDEDLERIEKQWEEGDEEEELKTETQIEIELMNKMKTKLTDPKSFDPR